MRIFKYKKSYFLFKDDPRFENSEESVIDQEYSCCEKLKIFLAEGCCFGLCCCFSKKVKINF